MRQTARFHERSNGEAYPGKGLLHFMHELTGVAKNLGIRREVIRRASSVCADASAMSLGRATSQPVLTAAALYVACREYKEPTTLRELADATGTDPRDVGRCYASILELLHISRPGLNGRSYVHHLTLKEPLTEEIYRTSEEIIRRSTSAGLGGRNPMTFAAAALYLASCSNGVKVTQSEVAEAAGVGEESVRECCKAIRTITAQNMDVSD